MRGVVKILIVLLLVLLVGGFVVSVAINTRNAAHRMACQNNLRQIGLACQNYQDSYGHFPTGTVANASLPPDKRLSWLTALWPPYLEGGCKSLLDKTKPWDADTNCPPRCSVKFDADNAMGYQEELVGELRIFLCPANPSQADHSLPSATHFVGIAGLGEQAAELPLSDPRAGFFGYDRRISAKDIKDGLATTMAVTEVLDGGPWTAGGWPTVRRLISSATPYLGQGGQFASLHWEGGDLFLLSRPVATNVLFADSSMRRFTATMSPQVFEALATIAGGERVDDLPPLATPP
jgi:hypothetical protein